MRYLANRSSIAIAAAGLRSFAPLITSAALVLRQLRGRRRENFDGHTLELLRLIEPAFTGALVRAAGGIVLQVGAVRQGLEQQGMVGEAVAGAAVHLRQRFGHPPHVVLDLVEHLRAEGAHRPADHGFAGQHVVGVAGVDLRHADHGHVDRILVARDQRLQRAHHLRHAHPERLPRIRSVVLGEGFTRRQALDLMNQHAINHVPVLDAAGRAVAVVERREIDEQILPDGGHVSRNPGAILELLTDDGLGELRYYLPGDLLDHVARGLGEGFPQVRLAPITARAVAMLLNDADVRAALVADGVSVPDGRTLSGTPMKPL